MTTISVIIPTYNRAHLITNTLNSLLQQTRVPDEILVIDDGSTDNTAEVLATFSAPVRYIRYTPNQGRSHARNVGIEHAVGDYLAFVDSDDTLPNDSFAIRAEYLDKHTEIDAVYGYAMMVDAHGQALGALNLLGHFPSGDLFALLVCQNFIFLGTFLVRKTALINARFAKECEPVEDHDFVGQIAQHHAITYINQCLAYYFQHDGMTMLARNEQKMLNATLTTLERLQQLPRFQHLTASQQADSLAWYGLRWAGTGNRRQMQQAFYRAITKAPLHTRTWIQWVRAWRLWWLRRNASPA